MIWDFGHLHLPFDLAQDGELAEPFVICGLFFPLVILRYVRLCGDNMISDF